MSSIRPIDFMVLGFLKSLLVIFLVFLGKTATKRPSRMRRTEMMARMRVAVIGV